MEVVAFNKESAGYKSTGKTAIQLQNGSTFTDIKTSAYTAEENEKIPIDSSLGSFTATLPAAPTDGTQVEFYDVGDSLDINPVSVDGNGSDIQDSMTPYSLNVPGSKTTFIYFNSTTQWRVY